MVIIFIKFTIHHHWSLLFAKKSFVTTLQIKSSFLWGDPSLWISDPRSVWIMVHQRNRRIHFGHGFAGFFDAPWSRQILDHWSELGSPQRNALVSYFDAPWSRQILDHWSELGSPQRKAPKIFAFMYSIPKSDLHPNILITIPSLPAMLTPWQ